MRLRRQLTTLLTLVLLGWAGTVPAEAPDSRVADRAMMLSRVTKWTPVAAIRIAFRTFHPQGMVRIGKNFYVSSVEIISAPRKLATPKDGHTYDAGTGVGHLFKIGPDGALLADLVLGEGPIYHPGGIDYDGVSIWVPVSEYRPDSRAIVYKVAPETMTATIAFRVADHIGGIVHDLAGRRITGLSWASRRFYSWPVGTDGTVQQSVAAPIVNPQSYIDYQDCHYAGARLMLCAGLAEYQVGPDSPIFPLGGLDVIDLATHRPVWQTPIALWAPSGRAMTQNPFWIEATATGLRAYFLPDDDDSTLFVYDTVTSTPAGAVAPMASPARAAPPAGTASPRRHSAP